MLEAPEVYKRLAPRGCMHGDTIRVKHVLRPLGVAMAGETSTSPTRTGAARAALSRVTGGGPASPLRRQRRVRELRELQRLRGEPHACGRVDDAAPLGVGRRALGRERRAVELQLIADYTEDNLSQLASVLDEAINSLGAEDRRAILLRFFEQLDFQSVGEALGSSEDAARMRVARAVQKLGSRLKRQGITLSAAGLGFVLATKTVTAAPCGLAACVSNVSLASVAKGGSALALLKEACCTKLNAGLVGAALVVALATLLITARHSDATGGAGVLEDLVAEADESPDAEMGVHTVSQSGVPALPVPAHDVPISVEESASTNPGKNSPQVVPLRPKASIPAPTIALQPSPLPIATINPRANQFAEVDRIHWVPLP